MSVRKKIEVTKDNAEEKMYELGRKYVLTKKIKKILKNIPNKNKKMEKEIQLFWSKYGVKNINTSWHLAYTAINGIKSPYYISEEVFYNIIEPRLNDRRYLIFYKDKNNYSKIISKLPQPITVAKNIRGKMFNSSDNQIDYSDVKPLLLAQDGQFIIKPSVDSGGGRSVKFIEVKNSTLWDQDRVVTIEELLNLYREDYIIQELVSQFSDLKKVYPYSLNTLRIVSWRQGLTINIISSVMRFGNNGSIIDNQASGGISCGVDANGKLQDFAVNKEGKKFYAHPYTNIPFEGIIIPNYNTICELLKEEHKKIPHFDLISWDVAIDEKANANFIEMNLRNQEINFHQFNNGPLFGNKTEELLRSVIENK